MFLVFIVCCLARAQKTTTDRSIFSTIFQHCENLVACTNDYFSGSFECTVDKKIHPTILTLSCGNMERMSAFPSRWGAWCPQHVGTSRSRFPRHVSCQPHVPRSRGSVAVSGTACTFSRWSHRHLACDVSASTVSCQTSSFRRWRSHRHDTLNSIGSSTFGERLFQLFPSIHYYFSTPWRSSVVDPWPFTISSDDFVLRHRSTVIPRISVMSH